MANDRYITACSWGLAGFTGRGFLNLNRIATLMNYTNYLGIKTDPDLKSLYENKRWKPLLKLIKVNKNKAEANLNKGLVHQLDSICEKD